MPPFYTRPCRQQEDFAPNLCQNYLTSLLSKVLSLLTKVILLVITVFSLVTKAPLILLNPFKVISWTNQPTVRTESGTMSVINIDYMQIMNHYYHQYYDCDCYDQYYDKYYDKYYDQVIVMISI